MPRVYSQAEGIEKLRYKTSVAEKLQLAAVGNCCCAYLHIFPHKSQNSKSTHSLKLIHCTILHFQRFYEALKAQGKPFEVVWVSRDREEEDLVEYYQDHHGEWVYLPFGSEQIP